MCNQLLHIQNKYVKGLFDKYINMLRVYLINFAIGQTNHTNNVTKKKLC